MKGGENLISFNCKVVDLGEHYKVIKYGKEICNTFPSFYREDSGNRNKTESRIKTKTRMLKNSERETFIDLVNLNFSVKDLFVTLTYKESEISLERGSRDFENWIKRLRERYGDFKYIAVRSFQDRGTLHYHVLISISRLSDDELKNGGLTWEHGSAKAIEIYWLNVSYGKSALTKYLVKNMEEFKADERSFGKRLFVKSRNLEKPEILKGNYDEVLAFINEKYPKLKLVEKSKFKTKYLGKMEITIYKK
jgi:hypothetical protein